MYKYSKQVKERFFSDQYLAFLWMYFRIVCGDQEQYERKKKGSSEDQDQINNEYRRKALEDFDECAMKTLKNAQLSLYFFILSLSQGQTGQFQNEQKYEQNYS